MARKAREICFLPEVLAAAAADARRDAGLSQTEAAAITSIPGSTISHIEQGRRRNIGLDTLWRMADAYHCSLDELVGRTH